MSSQRTIVFAQVKVATLVDVAKANLATNVGATKSIYKIVASVVVALS